MSGAFEAGGASTTAETLVMMSGAFEALDKDAKVIQAALWPSSSQWRRWHDAPQYDASLQRAHLFAPLA